MTDQRPNPLIAVHVIVSSILMASVSPVALSASPAAALMPVVQRNVTGAIVQKCALNMPLICDFGRWGKGVKMGTQENCHAPGFTRWQKRVQINGEKFWADPEMIPLLKELNKAGLKTRSHCSGHGAPDNRKWVAIRAENIEQIEIRKSDDYNEVLITWL